MIGDAYRSCRLATDEDFANKKKEEQHISLRNKILNFCKYFDKVNSMSIEDMETITNIISKYEKE